MKQQSFNTKTTIALIVTLLTWSSSYAGIKAGELAFNPFHLALYRYLVASFALAVYALITRMRLPDRRDIPLILLIGFIGFTVFSAALNYGELTVTASATGFLINMSPIFTALLAAMFLREHLSRNAWIGLVICFLGATLIAFGEGGGLHFNTGVMIVLVATLSFSVFMTLQKPLFSKYQAFDLTTYSIWAGTLFMLVFMPGLFQDISRAPWHAHLTVIYLGIFPAAIGNATWAYFMSKIPASRAANFLYINPILSTVIAFVWLGELPSMLTLIGGIIILAGLVLVGYSSIKENSSLM